MPASTDAQYHRAPQPMMWTTSAPSHHKHDERRHASGSSTRSGSYGRATSAYHNSGYRSGNGASGSSSAYSHPSPSSSSVTSTSSSLRTPPDLLLNGSGSVSTPLHSGKSLYGSRTGGKDAAEPLQFLSVSQVEDRLKILSRLTRLPVPSDLPSPPTSPRLASRDLPDMERSSSKKRKATDDRASSSSRPQHESIADYRASRRRSPSPRPAEPFASPQSSTADKRTLSKRSKTGTSPPASDDSDASPSNSLALPRAKVWTRELYFETAAAYRAKGRELKHKGDRRMREASVNVAGSTRSATLIAALEQTDALLLYIYAFWCEDTNSGACIANNWASLFGLLKYVKTYHDRSRMHILSGLCRLLEASVLRHVSAHEMRRLHHRLSRAAASASSPSGDDSTASDRKGTASGNDVAPSSMSELAQAMSTALSEQERSNRLMSQARQNVLSLAALTETYPALASQCRRMESDSAWITADQSELAARLDPSAAEHASEAGWAWPIDTSTPFPMLVCFARALLRAAAKAHGVDFDTEAVAVIAASTPASNASTDVGR